jgi:acid-sensing ion channel, other
MSKGILQRAKSIIFDYISHSSVHGVKYLAERKRSWVEKVWWITVFCISILGCGVLVLDAWNISPIIISFTAKPTPIWRIPFPAVTICPKNFARSDRINLTDIFLRQKFGEMVFERLSMEMLGGLLR